ncbi:MAG TPA: tRNA preQ1(34) S-adenosylmethionine ribosyltransferase-isomerase QueA [Candidatus Hydrogenedentes bacterium]|nr:tRNA preQ1(34) S-adenosylmethionine ribosyltransferase-isomerase QueA [Candidatus Hydrogenedentota bacterium]HNZ16752.1 tRNA preQ1(34) S-adenosylmethionine ribosyltransferase-isomerase QueA [Candidatus Hydrogenedentota bacterium]HQE77320.1 tRNA preQ1(34) S-adenosylmethionine ribosyltransferase-isomerase QueA [Candidatus Hydrogenedentota bacterium]HQH69110.1 tRNA preQ1(34) S-adenosylmethionine ribosyltransferase-isomerase QueA [Candidatus Hydrogenedentota bacterium]HQM32660.1 tRNA preQ1(34) S
MNTSELDYSLPEELIAQHPCEQRDESRLLVLDRASRAMTVDVFRSLPQYLRRGDCLVFNDTRVIRARLHGRKPTGGQVEVFLLHETGPGEWDALVRPSSKVKPGTPVKIAAGIEAVVGDRLPGGRRHVSFAQPDVLTVLEQAGEVPLPPYIRRDTPEASDLTRYQTIYANAPGAVAAPTAGLHFTRDVFRRLDECGVDRAFLTLHVGYGTFRPIQAERLEDHTLEPEPFTLTEETAAQLNRSRAAGGRITAVGTTVTRVLETQYQAGAYHPGTGETNRYIYPPYTFRAIDALQTNFHLPRSSLLALVCAFAGVDFVLEAYRFAVRERFRFYSYGDTMLIL